MVAAATAALLAEAAVIRAAVVAVTAAAPGEAVAIRVVVRQEAAVVPVEAVAAEDLTAAVPPAAALPAGIRPEAPHAAGK